MCKYIMSLSYYIFHSTLLKLPNLIRFACLKIFGNFCITLWPATRAILILHQPGTHSLQVTRDSSYWHAESHDTKYL
jgi:hypothetical protein